MTGDVFRQQHDEDVVPDPAGRVLEVSNERPDQLAIRGFDDDEGDARDLPLEPATDLLRPIDIVRNVDRRHV